MLFTPGSQTVLMTPLKLVKGLQKLNAFLKTFVCHSLYPFAERGAGRFFSSSKFSHLWLLPNN